MNKKGQLRVLLFMVSVIGIVLLFGFIGTVVDQTTTSRTAMNCDLTNLSIFEEGACQVADISPAVFFGALLSIALIILLAKIKIT